MGEFMDIARRILKSEMSAPERAYHRLVNCIENKGGDLTLSDRDLCLAALYAVRTGMLNSAETALDELNLRLMTDETPEQTERRLAA